MCWTSPPFSYNSSKWQLFEPACPWDPVSFIAFFSPFTSVSVQSAFRAGLLWAQENTAVVSVIPSDVYFLTMKPILETMIHILLPPSWVAFMAAFIASIYLFRECHFENINLKTGKQLRKKIERVFLWNESNKLYISEHVHSSKFISLSDLPPATPQNKDTLSGSRGSKRESVGILDSPFQHFHFTHDHSKVYSRWWGHCPNLRIHSYCKVANHRPTWTSSTQGSGAHFWASEVFHKSLVERILCSICTSPGRET